MESIQIEMTERASADQLIHLLWGSTPDKTKLSNGDLFSTLSFDAYRAYYNHLWTLTAGHANGQCSVLESPSDVNQLALWLADNKSREDILVLLEAKSPNASTSDYEESINLAARLLLMLKSGAVRYEVLPRRCLTWKAGPAKDFLSAGFAPDLKLNCGGVKLPKTFSAWSLETVSSIKIGFTDNLADHLLLVDDTRVLIFHHATFLECQRAME